MAGPVPLILHSIRSLLGMAALLGLAACWGDDARSVMFEGRGQPEISAAIAGLQADVGGGAIPVVALTRPATDTLLFTASHDGRDTARVQFVFVARDTGTRVFLASEIPDIAGQIAGRKQVLDHELVESRLYEGLAELARAFAAGQSREDALRQLETALGLAALATDPAAGDRALEVASRIGLSDGQDHGWEDLREGGFAAADDVMDDAGGTEIEAAQARGSRPQGFRSGGENPSPDGDWGSPSGW